MKHQTSATLPRGNSDDHASEYVIVEGWQLTMPPSKSKPQRRAGSFPLVFTVRFGHPSPNGKPHSYNLVRYKTVYEFWVNCDDFSDPDSAVNAVNRLVDLMNVPFPLRDVQLFWKTNVGNESGCEVSVANWDSVVVFLFRFLRHVRDFVREQEAENSGEKYPFVNLQISKFVKLPKEALEAALVARKRWSVNEWHDQSFRRPQTEMEWRMAVLQAQAIERVKFDGGEEEECCGICLTDLSVGSEVARLPCSHYTHERCILHWLRINNSCPFCRFNIAAIQGKTRPTPDHYWDLIPIH